LGEHQLDKLGVAGSSPARRTCRKPRLGGVFSFWRNAAGAHMVEHMPSMRLALSLLAGAAAIAVLPGSAGATWPGRAGLVLYNDFDNHSSAFTIHADGSHIRKIIERADESAWSPDGRHIVFSRDSGVFVARANGSHVHRVVTASDDETIFTPAWSPHGNHISFTGHFEVQTHGEHIRTSEFVFVVRSNGHHLRRLHKGHGAAWSPRNRRIAFVVGNRIRSIRPDGHKLHKLRRVHDYVDSVDYSPDGRRLVYQVGAGPGHIEWLDVRTHKHHTLPAKSVGWPLDVKWAPGGKRIAYVHQDFPKDGPSPPAIMRTIKPNASGRRDVFKFRGPGGPDNFAWQTLPR
jgi:hypothetical protein